MSFTTVTSRKNHQASMPAARNPQNQTQRSQPTIQSPFPALRQKFHVAFIADKTNDKHRIGSLIKHYLPDIRQKVGFGIVISYKTHDESCRLDDYLQEHPELGHINGLGQGWYFWSWKKEATDTAVRLLKEASADYYQKQRERASVDTKTLTIDRDVFFVATTEVKPVSHASVAEPPKVVEQIQEQIQGQIQEQAVQEVAQPIDFANWGKSTLAWADLE